MRNHNDKLNYIADTLELHTHGLSVALGCTSTVCEAWRNGRAIPADMQIIIDEIYLLSRELSNSFPGAAAGDIVRRRLDAADGQSLLALIQTGQATQARQLAERMNGQRHAQP